MHDLPVAPYGACGHEAQRVLLLELVIDPPEAGEPLDALERRLRLPPAVLRSALRALEAAGLARSRGEQAWPTVAALSFETLFPARL
jgi:hypothetical protein